MTGKTPAGTKKAAIKFCGGCNPGYDRLAVAEEIKRRLLEAGHRLVSDSSEAEVVIAVCGCACACADVSGLDIGRLIFITKPEMADNIGAIISSLYGRAVNSGDDK